MLATGVDDNKVKVICYFIVNEIFMKSCTLHIIVKDY